MDMMELEYEEGSVDEILAQDVIDHVTAVECKTLLRRFYDWLKPNGVLNIHTPNLEFLGKEASRGNQEALKWLYGSAGEGNTNYETNLIRWCYTRGSLGEILRSLGFIIIHNQLEQYGYAFRMIGVKR